MAKKQTIAKETVAAAPRRAANPRAPRVTAATHSRAASTETALAPPSAEFTAASDMENPHDVIARVAYGFWEARGQQSGSAAEDWFRAEREYQKLTTVKLK